MAAESVKAYAVCRGCKTQWKINAIWDSAGAGSSLVVLEDLRPCPLCAGTRCDIERVTLADPAA